MCVCGNFQVVQDQLRAISREARFEMWFGWVVRLSLGWRRSATTQTIRQTPEAWRHVARGERAARAASGTPGPQPVRCSSRVVLGSVTVLKGLVDLGFRLRLTPRRFTPGYMPPRLRRSCHGLPCQRRSPHQTVDGLATHLRWKFPEPPGSQANSQTLSRNQSLNAGSRGSRH